MKATILSRLDNVRAIPWGWSARCPSCGDGDPSGYGLGVIIDPDTRDVTLVCALGCTDAEILASVGLDPEAVGAVTAACDVCGQRFHATRLDAKTCSNACRQRAYRERKRAAA